MPTIIIEHDFHGQLPPDVQKLAPIGTQYQVSSDPNGRIILTPAGQPTDIDETFAAQVTDFIDQYRPALEVLAR